MQYQNEKIEETKTKEINRGDNVHHAIVETSVWTRMQIYVLTPHGSVSLNGKGTVSTQSVPSLKELPKSIAVMPLNSSLLSLLPLKLPHRPSTLCSHRDDSKYI